MTRKDNEQKLLKSIDNIIKNYVKIDEEILKAVANKDMDKFNQLIGQASDNGFLSSIMVDYDAFSQEMFNRIEFAKEDEIKQIFEEQKKLKDFKPLRVKPIKKKLTLASPGKLKSKKGKRQSWSKKENARVKLLLKSNVKPSEIINDINKNRLTESQTLRTNQSVYSKIFSIRKQMKKEN